jgi:hypothetical protein
MRRAAAVITIGAVVVVAGVVAGVTLSRAAAQPQAAAGPPPLGNPADWDSGLTCSTGKTLANGFYGLENDSDKSVRITSVRLIGGPGQAMTSAAYLVPWGPAFSHGLIGLNPPWPPTVPWWKQRRLAVGATIGPHTDANLVFAQTRTEAHPKSATPEITYAASGNSYTIIEPIRSVVALNCHPYLG